jgi:SAM-dependent methyltransferase
MIHTSGWLNTLTGRNLLREEVRQVRRALDGVFGDHFVQIGNWGDPGLFRRLARTRRTAVFTTEPGAGGDAVTAPDCLAIASDSVDAVLLPHTLELADDPHAVLREIDRILRPHGHIIVLGFNPMGWWGVRHALSRRRFPPETQRLISERRLCDWLRLLDFTVGSARYYYFVPPLLRGAPPRHVRSGRTKGDVGTQTAFAGSALHESTGRVASDSRAPGSRRSSGIPRGMSARRPFPAWFAFAGCYALVACKQQFVVTPIRLAWKRRTALVGGLVNPTTRNAA